MRSSATKFEWKLEIYGKHTVSTAKYKHGPIVTTYMGLSTSSAPLPPVSNSQCMA